MVVVGWSDKFGVVTATEGLAAGHNSIDSVAVSAAFMEAMARSGSCETLVGCCTVCESRHSATHAGSKGSVY